MGQPGDWVFACRWGENNFDMFTLGQKFGSDFLAYDNQGGEFWVFWSARSETWYIIESELLQ